MKKILKNITRYYENFFHQSIYGKYLGAHPVTYHI